MQKKLLKYMCFSCKKTTCLLPARLWRISIVGNLRDREAPFLASDSHNSNSVSGHGGQFDEIHLTILGSLYWHILVCTCTKKPKVKTSSTHSFIIILSGQYFQWDVSVYYVCLKHSEKHLKDGKINNSLHCPSLSRLLYLAPYAELMQNANSFIYA